MVATRWSLSQGVKRASVWQRAKAADLITAFAHYRESRRKEKLRNRVVKKHARRTLDAAKNKAKDDPVARVEQAKAKPNKQENERAGFTSSRLISRMRSVKPARSFSSSRHYLPRSWWRLGGRSVRA